MFGELVNNKGERRACYSYNGTDYFIITPRGKMMHHLTKAQFDWFLQCFELKIGLTKRMRYFKG